MVLYESERFVGKEDPDSSFVYFFVYNAAQAAFEACANDLKIIGQVKHKADPHLLADLRQQISRCEMTRQKK